MPKRARNNSRSGITIASLVGGLLFWVGTAPEGCREVESWADLLEFRAEHGDIALGEGESQRRRMVMEADGALEKKLEALVTINTQYAKAIGEHSGPWVPSFVFGASPSGTASNGATELISLLTAQTAKALSVDMSMPTAKPIKAAPAQ